MYKLQTTKFFIVLLKQRKANQRKEEQQQVAIKYHKGRTFQQIGLVFGTTN